MAVHPGLGLVARYADRYAGKAGVKTHTPRCPSVRKQPLIKAPGVVLRPTPLRLPSGGGTSQSHRDSPAAASPADAVKWSLVSAGLAIVVILLKLFLR